MKKFELTDEYIFHRGKKLSRIRALRDFGSVKRCDIGGFVEKESNLSQEGNCWIHDNAKVFDYGTVWSNATLWNEAEVSGHASASDGVSISDSAIVNDCAYVGGEVDICDNAWVHGYAYLNGNVRVFNKAEIGGPVMLTGEQWICGEAVVRNQQDCASVQGFGRAYRNTTFFRDQEGGVSVSCGCFYGTLQEFREKVKQTHGESKLAKEYLMIAELMDMHFSKEE